MKKEKVVITAETGKNLKEIKKYCKKNKASLIKTKEEVPTLPMGISPICGDPIDMHSLCYHERK